MLGQCRALRSWETRTELARGGGSGMDLGYIAHKSQTLVGPPHGKRIRLDCGAEEKDPGEDEGGGGMRVRHAVSVISCPILTCPF